MLARCRARGGRAGVGASAMIDCIDGVLLSRMRSGFVCSRRRASSSRSSAWRSKCVDQRGAMRPALVGIADRVDRQADAGRRGPARATAARAGSSARHRRRVRESRAPRRRTGGTGGSGPSAAARAGTSAPRATRVAAARRSGCARSRRGRCPAVASGRSVRLSPDSRSSNVYISFSTTSVASPIARTNSGVGSTIGARRFR